MAEKMLCPRSKIWIETDNNNIVFGGGRLALFQAIAEYGSINRAAAELGMSYRAAWGKITATEKHLGIKMVEKFMGGTRSGSELTPEAIKFMEAYRQFKKESVNAVDQLFCKHFHSICKTPMPK